MAKSIHYGEHGAVSQLYGVDMFTTSNPGLKSGAVVLLLLGVGAKRVQKDCFTLFVLVGVGGCWLAIYYVYYY